MKKTQLRKIIKESIKELINEQQQGGCTAPLNQGPPATWGNEPCIQTWSVGGGFGNTVMVKPWFRNWVLSRTCANYTWPANNLPLQAEAIMAASPNPQTGSYNNWTDILNAANAAWGAGAASQPYQPQKFKFKSKMAKGMYSQCMKQACGC